MASRKNIFVSVINDIIYDQRVLKFSDSLSKMGFSVHIIGRKFKTSPDAGSIPFKITRFRLFINKGPFFYAWFNIRLFLYLMFKNVDVLFANDLDTLPANYLASVLKKIPLIYDSHEYFTEVPELSDRKHVQSIWKGIERKIVPRLKYMFTVNDSIAKLYMDEYKIPVHVVRNVPVRDHAILPSKQELRKELSLPADKILVIMQGAGINIHRGAEEALEALHDMPGVMLLIIGSGDVFPAIQKKVVDKQWKNILVIPKLPYEQLKRYTTACDIGLTLDKPNNLNYKFSLPNKLFDYLHAGLAIVASDLPEVKKIVQKYKVGEVIPEYSIRAIAQTVNRLSQQKELLSLYQGNASVAMKDLNWQNESGQIFETLKPLAE